MYIEKIKRRFQSKKYNTNLISSEINVDFYRSQTSKTLNSSLECASHYLTEGWKKNLDPTPYFSTQYYLENNADVKAAGGNPFIHYLLFGKGENRRPGPNAFSHESQSLGPLNISQKMEIIEPHFDVEGYSQRSGQAFETPVAAMLHYINHGEKAGLKPNDTFDSTFYRADNADLKHAQFNLFLHYLLHGGNEGRRGNDEYLKRFRKSADLIRKDFDTDYYLSQNPNLTNYSSDPILNFLEIGYEQGLNPSKEFSSTFYNKMNPDLAAANMNGFVHYVAHGRAERRSPKPYFEQVENFKPLISVIIPNYNHARFLPQRLASVVGQSYENIEIIILDDVSSDNSREVIGELVEKYSDKNIKTHFNEVNSGGVFNQWSKGMELASGEYIWICESDDFCELNFLESLVPHFADRSVNIAFGRIQFANSDGDFMDGMDGYRERSEPGIWDAVTKRPAQSWFANGFTVNNVIANVGGCVFRKPDLSLTVWDKAKSFKIAGDWYLYIQIAAGGQIVFDPNAIAYFRQHEKNTSGSNLDKLYFYNEIAAVNQEINENWSVPAETQDRFLEQALAQFNHWDMASKGYVFEDIFTEINDPSTSKLHILVGFLGFHSGGGEVFAINLANALKEKGHIVSMLALNMKSINPSMYSRLSKGIPVYSPGNFSTYERHEFFEAAGVSLIHSNVLGVEGFVFQLDRFNKVEVPYLVSLHGSYDGMDESQTEVRRLLDLTTENVSMWVNTAHKNKAIFDKIGFDTDGFQKIENAMPLDDRPYRQTREMLGISEEAFVFTFVARGVEGKGWNVMIKTFQKFQKAHGPENVHLILVGNGAVAEKAVQKIKKKDSISYLGYESEINGIYRMSDCAVVPTRFVGESFPLCVVQAVQEGLPVVATDHGEIKSMLSNGDVLAGELIDFDADSTRFGASLLDAMDKVYTNKKHRSKLISNVSKIKEKFEMSKMISKYEGAYHRAREQHQNGR